MNRLYPELVECSQADEPLRLVLRQAARRGLQYLQALIDPMEMNPISLPGLNSN